MNIINKAFLKLALLPEGLYHKLGINTRHLSSILNIKLMMDDRRPNTFHQSRTRRRKKEQQISMATVGTMLLSLLLGGLYLFAFALGNNTVTHLTFYFSLFFFMLSATLISDFTSVLIDVRDNFIILPRPVNDRTIVTARLLHIFIHVCKIIVPMSIPGWIYVLLNYTVAGSLVFLLIVLFVTLFSIFFINALYILILKITSPQKFQSIISYIQIIFAIVVYAGYQMVPRMVDQLHLSDFDVTTKKGIEVYPIYWFATCWQVLYTFSGQAKDIILAILGFILPFASLYVVVRFLAPSFNNKLTLINNSSSPETGKRAQRSLAEINKKSSYSSLLGRLLTRSNAEKMGFLFSWKMSSRSRDFKMKVYPSIGYLAVYIFIVFLQNKHLNLQEIQEQSTAGKIIVISALYFGSFLLTMAINQMVYSDKYKASWIYFVAPLRKPGEVILGASKAVIFKFYIPLVAFITIAGLVMVGISILPNILLGVFNELLIATLLVYAGNKVFPFSVHQDTNVKTGTFIRNMALLIISGIIALGHFIIYDILAAVVLCAILSIIATWLLMGSIKGSSWEDIRSRYSE